MKKQQLQVENNSPAAIEVIPQSKGAMAEAAIGRASQETRAAMTIAKQFPRDETTAVSRIMRACKRPGLAESALYSYPRGNETVTGPSIRLAECLAQNWGNLDFGIVELTQKSGESEVMAYCWDLETNCRQVKIFTVKHWRHTKAGGYALHDPRDIYEMVANSGARRLRACILGVIPGDIQDQAIDECEKTLKGVNKEPLIDRIRKMIPAFEGLGVTQVMIEMKLGHKVDEINERELISLRKIYKTISDGMGKREDYFTLSGDEKTEPENGGKSKTDALADKLKTKNEDKSAKEETPSKAETKEEKKDAKPETSQGTVAYVTPQTIELIKREALSQAMPIEELLADYKVESLEKLTVEQGIDLLNGLRGGPEPDFDGETQQGSLDTEGF